MSQASILGFFDKDFKKKNIPVSPKKSFVAKHNASSSKKNVVRKEKSVQQFLAVGQKFGPSKCSICGMMYSSGIIEDEELHTSFHRQFQREMKLPVCSKHIDPPDGISANLIFFFRNVSLKIHYGIMKYIPL